MLSYKTVLGDGTLSLHCPKHMSCFQDELWDSGTIFWLGPMMSIVIRLGKKLWKFFSCWHSIALSYAQFFTGLVRNGLLWMLKPFTVFVSLSALQNQTLYLYVRETVGFVTNQHINSELYSRTFKASWKMCI